MALDSRNCSMAELPNNDEGTVPPCQETPSSSSPVCPTCGSTMLPYPSEAQSTAAAREVGDEPSTPNFDSQVFSRVLMIAISQMSMIAKETIDQKRLLTEDKDAMVGILENVCLMKSTIKYLLHHETYDGSSNDVISHGTWREDDVDTHSREVKMSLDEANTKELEEEEDDKVRSGSFKSNMEERERENVGGDDDGDKEKASSEKGDQGFKSCTSQLTECTYLSRKDDDDYYDYDHRNIGSDDDGHCSSSVEAVSEEKVRAILTISRGVIGGIATISLIAKDASKGKVLLADDKEALADMLDAVRKVKLLI